MSCCTKCGKTMGGVLLVAGVLYLLGDLGVITWWTLNWWTLAFLLAGLCYWGGSSCKDCQKCCEMPKKKGKKK